MYEVFTNKFRSFNCFNSIIDHANLINVVNERTEESFENNLWVYRSRVTLEHLTHTLQQKEMIDKYPILHEFLHTVRQFSL